jgi:hypothetical protein
VTTEEILLNQFHSPLLSIAQLAQVLNRSPEGLRITLSGDNEVARKINGSRIKIGRRVFFRTAEIARMIDAA